MRWDPRASEEERLPARSAVARGAAQPHRQDGGAASRRPGDGRVRWGSAALSGYADR